DLVQRAVARVDAIRSDPPYGIALARTVLVDRVDVLPIRRKAEPRRILRLHDLARLGLDAAGLRVEVIQVDAFTAVGGIGADEEASGGSAGECGCRKRACSGQPQHACDERTARKPGGNSVDVHLSSIAR